MNRPFYTWRVCGERVTVPLLDENGERPKGRGCNCTGWETSNPKTLAKVLARLDGKPVDVADEPGNPQSTDR